MKKFNAEKELQKVEDELCRVGARMSKPFIARAKELVVEMSKFKGVKLERLVMGMGGWSLVGTIPFKEVWSGGVEEGVQEIELAIQFDTGRNLWLEHFEAVNPGITAVGMELNQILEMLTQNKYLTIFDITDEQMKQLIQVPRKERNMKKNN